MPITETAFRHASAKIRLSTEQDILGQAQEYFSNPNRVPELDDTMCRQFIKNFFKDFEQKLHESFQGPEYEFDIKQQVNEGIRLKARALEKKIQDLQICPS